MKNDEILIILEPKNDNTQILIKVDSRISYSRLIDGINHGLEKLGIDPPAEWHFINAIQTDVSGEQNEKSLRELGFVTGTLLNSSGMGNKWFFDSYKLDSQLLSKRYDNEDYTIRNTMRYNISNRVITEIEDTVIEILSPGKPPQPVGNSILDTIIPTIISFGTLYGFRKLFIPKDYSSKYMLLYMGGSVLSTFAIQLFRFFKNKNDLKNARKSWKSNYENYLDRICQKIEKYQEQDVKYLNCCFPSMQKLIESIDNVSDSLFSRSVNDFDFMNIRFGNSNQVSSIFTIQHDVKDEIELGITFNDEDGHIKINLIEEENEKEKQLDHRYLNELSEYLVTEKYRYLKAIDNEYPPLIIDFKNCGSMGCVDFQDSEQNLLDHIILELASNHKPHDLQFVFFFKPESNVIKQQERISNYRCLPHFNELFDGVAQFVFNDNSAGLVFSMLESIMNGRMLEQQLQDEEKISSDNYRQIVCIFEYDYKLKEKAFSRYLPVPPKKGVQYINQNGLTFIFAVDYKELLPPYCGIILQRNVTKSSFFGTVQFRNQIQHRNRQMDTQTFEDEYIFNVKKADEYNKAFSQLSAFYSLHIRERGSVPEAVTLFDLYPGLKEKIDSKHNKEEKIGLIEEYIISEWANTENNVTKTLSVPIGQGESGNVYLDLHENKDGPHMLVAGTTGSGKSETMLTYLIGLCMRFSPQYLNLMLVDMKGNSFAGRLKSLPHCVATVDNISSEKSGISPIYMLKRFLEILKAEIKRRELIFEEYGVDKLDNYIEDAKKITAHVRKGIEGDISSFNSNQQKIIRKLLKDNKTAKDKKYPPVLAHLVFVVDEFTELKRFGNETDTDYIGELTSIARVGRTLGLHMILVSQNIENAITDDIRVNTRSRICLKVATRGASKEMLDGRTDAYSDMPQGRGYFLVGSGSDTYKYFQSGYASENMEQISEPQTKIVQLNTCGNHTEFYDSYKDNKTLNEIIEKRNKDDTQLNAVIKAIINIAEKNKNTLIYLEPDSVFQNPLDTLIKYSDFSQSID